MSELTFKEKKMIRAQRFGGAAQTATMDTQQVIKQLEEDKKKRQERAERFGVETKEQALEKKKERQERFNQAQDDGQDDKQKIADRKARFGVDNVPGSKKGTLEFTLDEYKSSFKKGGKGKGDHQKNKHVAKKFKKGNGFKDKRHHGSNKHHSGGKFKKRH